MALVQHCRSPHTSLQQYRGPVPLSLLLCTSSHHCRTLCSRPEERGEEREGREGEREKEREGRRGREREGEREEKRKVRRREEGEEKGEPHLMCFKSPRRNYLHPMCTQV